MAIASYIITSFPIRDRDALWCPALVVLAMWWFGWLYDKNMEFLIGKIQENSRHNTPAKKTGFLEQRKNAKQRKCYTYTSVYEGHVLLNGLDAILPTLVHSIDMSDMSQEGY